MILPDIKIAQEIKSGRIDVDPFDVDTSMSPREIVEESDMLQPSSLDVHVSNEWIKFEKMSETTYISPFEDHEYGEEMVTEDNLLIKPGEFVLGRLEQRINLPRDIRATVEGRSSWGRLAITPHIEAGYIDPGYEGNVTLEIVNLGEMPVEIPSGSRFCQLEFARLEEPSVQGYDGKYQGDNQPKGSQLSEENPY